MYKFIKFIFYTTATVFLISVLFVGYEYRQEQKLQMQEQHKKNEKMRRHYVIGLKTCYRGLKREKITEFAENYLLNSIQEKRNNAEKDGYSLYEIDIMEQEAREWADNEIWLESIKTNTDSD